VIAPTTGSVLEGCANVITVTTVFVAKFKRILDCPVLPRQIVSTMGCATMLLNIAIALKAGVAPFASTNSNSYARIPTLIAVTKEPAIKILGVVFVIQTTMGRTVRYQEVLVAHVQQVYARITELVVKRARSVFVLLDGQVTTVSLKTMVSSVGAATLTVVTMVIVISLLEIVSAILTTTECIAKLAWVQETYVLQAIVSTVVSVRYRQSIVSVLPSGQEAFASIQLMASNADLPILAVPIMATVISQQAIVFALLVIMVFSVRFALLLVRCVLMVYV